MDRPVQRWIEHVRTLAEVHGPRGPTTPEEARALDYCEATLAATGLPVSEDRFLSSGSVFRPHVVAGMGVLVAFALYPLFGPIGRWIAAALALAVLLSEILEMTLRPNPLTWLLPKFPGRNVFAKAESSGPAEQDLVLIGHVDTQRTPRIFSTPRWFLAYRIFSTLTFASFTYLAVLYWLGAITGWPWVWAASSPAALFAVGLIAMCVEAELSPFTPGANDNATAAALVLTLAEDLKREPLDRTRVWLLCSGCEEAQHEGAQTFFRRHRPEFRRPRAIAFEMLGCSGPGWLTREGILLPLRPDPQLEALASRVATAHPDLGAYPVRLTGGVTEAADARAAGVPAMALIGLTREGKAPYWHLPTDTVDKLDAAVMDRAYRFTRELIRAIDERPEED
jgi:hypothetical protein